jgi:hypothetical protein
MRTVCVYDAGSDSGSCHGCHKISRSLSTIALIAALSNALSEPPRPTCSRIKLTKDCNQSVPAVVVKREGYVVERCGGSIAPGYLADLETTSMRGKQDTRLATLTYNVLAV